MATTDLSAGNRSRMARRLLDFFQGIGAIERLLGKLSLRGAYIDYWTCVHFGSGLVLGCLAAQQGLSLAQGFGLAAALLLLWELIEPPLHRLLGREFPEKITNQVVDILIGLVGFGIGFGFVRPEELVILLLDILDFLSR